MNIQEIISKVIKGHKHEHYKETVYQSDFGEEVTTGKSQEKYIIRLKTEWNEKESDLDARHKKEIAQAKRIYNSATPAAYRKLAGYFERVFRVDKAANKIEPVEKNSLSEKFNYELGNFGGTTLLNYLETNYLFLNGVDPNAWLLITKEVVEGEERIKPIIVRSKDVLDYKIELGILQYLAIQSGYSVKDKEIKEWFFYVKGAKHRVLEDDEALTSEDLEGSEVITIENKKYHLFTETNSLPKIPAIRWGYMFNYDTGGKTYAYFWDGAKNLMRDLIDRKFQLDMSYMLHVFLQKVSYGDRCTYNDGTNECNGGQMTGTKTSCPSCKGTGIKGHKDASDLLVLALPEEGDGKVLITPDKIASYITLPFEIVKEQRDQVSILPIKMTEAVFGVDLDRTGSGITTATEVDNSKDLAADKLSTFAEGLTHVQKFVVDCIAETLGIPISSYENSLSYPNEFGLESLEFLLNRLKAAKEAGASFSIIKSIEDKIAMKQNKGNKDKMMLDNALKQFKPFKQLTSDQVETKLSNLSETNKFRVAFEFFDFIAQDIEELQPAFAKLTRVKQKELFNRVLASYIDEVKAEIEANRDLFREEIETIDNEDQF